MILLIAAFALSIAGAFLIGVGVGKRNRKIDLTGLGAQEAFAFYLVREKARHREDIAKINQDLRMLDRAGIKAADIPLSIWIQVVTK